MGLNLRQLPVLTTAETLIQLIRDHDQAVDLSKRIKWHDVAYACEKLGETDVLEYIYKHYHRSIVRNYEGEAFVFKGELITDVTAFRKREFVVKWVEEQKELTAARVYQNASRKLDAMPSTCSYNAGTSLSSKRRQVDMGKTISSFHQYGLQSRSERTTEVQQQQAKGSVKKATRV